MQTMTAVAVVRLPADIPPHPQLTHCNTAAMFEPLIANKHLSNAGHIAAVWKRKQGADNWCRHWFK